MDPLDSEADPFKPPPKSILVECIHCGEQYDSYRIEWRVIETGDGPHGFWCCPIEGCDGAGFGFDIFPVNPEDGVEFGIHFSEFDEEDEDYDFDDEDDFDAGGDPNGKEHTNGNGHPEPEDDIPF